MRKTIFFLFITMMTALWAEPKKILVGSPIRQKPEILKEFLASLDFLEKNSFTLDYYFIDDNESETSRRMLEDFANEKEGRCFLKKAEQKKDEAKFICNEITHFWKDELCWKVAAFRDEMIAHARDNDYDYLFLIDSDMVLHPHTVEQLLSADKEIVSNIFWTSWSPGTMELPNAWLRDVYVQHEQGREEELTKEESQKRFYTFINKLKEPGTYEVGGLCACTLVSRSALHKGVAFRKIKNLTFWGEDRHFCVRAAALGIPLFIDTHLPAFHIYRESDLARVAAFKRRWKPEITLSMIMKNEEDRYLRKVLESAREYISNAVIIDDGSTDKSAQLCLEILKDIPLKLIRNTQSQFSNEIELRKLQWKETIQTNPDWILVLDADEIFEDNFKDQIHELLKDRSVDAYAFRLYDLWDEEHYREDPCWKAHQYYRPFLIRYTPEIENNWRETPQHCGRMPVSIWNSRIKNSDLRLKHYGWAKEEDRIAKYNRYKKLDPDAKYGWKEQYESILDTDPHLVAWTE